MLVVAIIDSDGDLVGIDCEADAVLAIVFDELIDIVNDRLLVTLSVKLRLIDDSVDNVPSDGEVLLLDVKVGSREKDRVGDGADGDADTSAVELCVLDGPERVGELLNDSERMRDGVAEFVDV